MARRSFPKNLLLQAPTSFFHQGRRGRLSWVEFLGERSDVLHSRAFLPLIPPPPFSHKGRRGRQDGYDI
jgi:hypothetical protein